MNGSFGARDTPSRAEGWPRTAGRLLGACMALLAAAAAGLLLTRPVHRVEGDFLQREDQGLADAWLREQLEHPVAERRARAYQALARVRGPEALGPLLGALADPAPSVRASAAFAIGNVLDPRAGAAVVPDAAMAALVRALADDERVVATRAVEALGKLGRQDAASQLPRTAAPVATAMTALVRLGAADQAVFVADYLDSDDQDSRWAAALAADALGLARTPRVWQRLQPLLTDDNDFVRAAALRAAAGGEAEEETLALVRDNLGHRDPKVRYEARRALETLAGSAAADALPAGEPFLAPGGRTAPLAPLLRADDYQRVAKTLGARLRARTPLGDFDIELDYDQAPLTAEYVRRRAAAGALDGSAFAAVRPNGYAVVPADLGPLRSELNPRPFLRGSVGLLRRGGFSGGGFFLCLTPLPLADGRYVNFGRLVSGDRELDAISPGTPILSLRPVP